ncbi:MAG: efflux RND transporter periplasmic adaptor subunit [Deltaproteobacteria bacterium]|nr:efflux RND transporter periplasmic adaptor subunit [Deltaproteobacteria bacterium]
MKRALIFVGILILLGATLYWAGAESRKETKASAPAVGNRHRVIPVETVGLHRGTLERHLYLTGSIVAEATVDVFSKVSGILEKIQVNQGDRVEADQVIAMVEREEKEAELEEDGAALDVLRARWAQMETGARPEEIAQAEQLVRQAKASWETSLDNYTRLKKLKDSDYISQQLLDEAMLKVTLNEAEYSSASEKLTLLKKGARQEDRDALLAQIRQAEARMRLSEMELKNTMIRAPIDGIISKRFVDKGALVSKTTPIVRIVAMDRVKAVVQVVESELAQLRCGTAAGISVDAYKDQVFRGKITCIGPTVDPNSRTADVEIQVDNRDYRLKPGMFARVNLVVQRRNGVLLLSKDSLLRESGPTRVFIHDNGKASLREVSLGLEGEQNVEVLGGLEEGDEVIVAGHYELRDGMPVKIIRRHKNP